LKLPSLNTILLIGAAVLLTMQLRSCFDRVHKPEQMIRNEERLKYLEQERLKDSVNYVEVMAMYDSLIVISKQKFDELENRKQPIKNAIKQSNTVVDNFDREQLRRAFADGR